MTSHEQYQAELPAYIAGRLEQEDRRRLEEHLEACADCRGIVATGTGLSAAIREEGDAIFEPHPPEMELRQFALGPGEGGARERIQRHLTTCAPCELEVAAWRARRNDGVTRLPAVGRTTRRSAPAIIVASAAAGLVLGIGLAFLARSLGPGSTPAVGEKVQHIVLPASPLRGSAGRVIRRLSPDQRSIEVEFGLTAPQAAPDEAYRFEIRRDTGEAIWFTALSAGEVARSFEDDGVIGFSFPTSLLGPGRYVCVVTSPAGSGEQDVRRFSIELLPPE